MNKGHTILAVKLDAARGHLEEARDEIQEVIRLLGSSQRLPKLHAECVVRIADTLDKAKDLAETLKHQRNFIARILLENQEGNVKIITPPPVR
jgi:hypothetical protein